MRHINVWKKITKKTALIGLFTTSLALSACGNAASSVAAKDITVKKLGLTSGPIRNAVLMKVEGTYTQCLDHTNGDPWEAGTADYTGTITNPLKVVLADPDCVLQITALTYQDASSLALVTYNTLVGLPLDVALQSSGVAFADGVGGDPDFYANASRGAFTADFPINIIISDDIRLVSKDVPFTFATVVGTPVVGEQVPAPQYPIANIDISAVNIQVDAFLNVVSAAGSIGFTVSGQKAQNYVIVDVLSGGADPTNYDDVKNTYDNAPVHFGIGATGNFSIPISDFNLVGSNLDGPGVVKYVIKRNVDTSSNVASFQVTTISFKE